MTSKFFPVLFALSLLAADSSFATPPPQQITLVGSTISDQMPGSPIDFTFAGNSTDYAGLSNPAGSNTPGTTVLDDFSLKPGTSTSGLYHVNYAGKGTYPTAEAPVGYTGTVGAPSTLQTAVVYHSGPGVNAPDLLTFTLGSSPGFDYDDFDVWVMYSNVGVANQDEDIDLTLLNSAGTSTLASIVQSVTDDQDGTENQVRFEEFTITGATAGDLLEIGATPDSGTNAVIGGVSFESLPEPSTWALFGLGAPCLFWRLRRHVSTF